MITSLLTLEVPLGSSWDWTEFSTFNDETSLLSTLAFLIIHVVVIVRFVRLLICKRVDGDHLSRHTSQRINAHFILSAVVFMLAIELAVFLSTPHEGLADLIQGTDPN